MDMKKILQAFDSAAAKAKQPTAGAEDMKRFISAVSDASVKENVHSFEEDSIGGQANEFLINADNINDMVMSEIEKIKINADPELLKDLMDKFNQFMTAYHSVGKEILQPDLFKDDVQLEANAEKELDSIESHPAADDPAIKKAIADKRKEISDKKESIGQDLAFKDYFSLEEAKRSIK